MTIDRAGLLVDHVDDDDVNNFLIVLIDADDK